ncbi:MAG: AI-2E family transporter, partial [Deltaproteobacteria bacterium]|nr:AI-2E family transporter [Deltaproteobacteria bacterium]
MKKKSSPVKSPRGPSNNLSPPSSKELSAQFKSEESDKSRDIFKLTGLSGFPALAMGLGFLFLLAIVLKGLRIIFLPMILAFFISCILNPLVVFFTGRGFPRSLSVLLTLSLGLCAMWLAFNYAVGNLTDFAEGFPRYKGRLDELVGRAARFINGRFNFITLDLVKSKLSEISYGAILSSFLNSVFTFTGYLALTIIFLLYFLPSLPSLPNKLQLAFPGQ